MNEIFIKTPIIESREIGTQCGSEVFLKLENTQPSGSFKNRAIYFLCTHYAQSRKAKCFVIPSGGNAALATAYTGRQLHIPVKVVVPNYSQPFMIERIKNEGAEVIVHGSQWHMTETLAHEISKETGHFLIHPFDHPLTWKGNATMIHEIKETNIKPDAIVLSVGGGGLLCGVIQGLHEVGWSDVPCFTAETEGAASFAKSILEKKHITLNETKTIATSLSAPKVAKKALDWTKKHPIFPHIVTDKEAMQATLRFANDHRFLVEPACGAALSLVYDKKINPSLYKKIVIIVCGGGIVTRMLMKENAAKVGLEF